MQLNVTGGTPVRLWVCGTDYVYRHFHGVRSVIELGDYNTAPPLPPPFK